MVGESEDNGSKSSTDKAIVDNKEKKLGADYKLPLVWIDLEMTGMYL